MRASSSSLGIAPAKRSTVSRGAKPRRNAKAVAPRLLWVEQYDSRRVFRVTERSLDQTRTDALAAIRRLDEAIA